MDSNSVLVEKCNLLLPYVVREIEPAVRFDLVTVIKKLEAAGMHIQDFEETLREGQSRAKDFDAFTCGTCLFIERQGRNSGMDRLARAPDFIFFLCRLFRWSTLPTSAHVFGHSKVCECDNFPKELCVNPFHYCKVSTLRVCHVIKKNITFLEHVRMTCPPKYDALILLARQLLFEMQKIAREEATLPLLARVNAKEENFDCPDTFPLSENGYRNCFGFLDFSIISKDCNPLVRALLADPRKAEVIRAEMVRLGEMMMRTNRRTLFKSSTRINNMLEDVQKSSLAASTSVTRNPQPIEVASSSKETFSTTNCNTQPKTYIPTPTEISKINSKSTSKKSPNSNETISSSDLYMPSRTMTFDKIEKINKEINSKIKKNQPEKNAVSTETDTQKSQFFCNSIASKNPNTYSMVNMLSQKRSISIDLMPPPQVPKIKSMKNKEISTNQVLDSNGCTSSLIDPQTNYIPNPLSNKLEISTSMVTTVTCESSSSNTDYLNDFPHAKQVALNLATSALLKQYGSKSDDLISEETRLLRSIELDEIDQIISSVNKTTTDETNFNASLMTTTHNVTDLLNTSESQASISHGSSFPSSSSECNSAFDTQSFQDWPDDLPLEEFPIPDNWDVEAVAEELKKYNKDL